MNATNNQNATGVLAVAAVAARTSIFSASCCISRNIAYDACNLAALHCAAQRRFANAFNTL